MSGYRSPLSKAVLALIVAVYCVMALAYAVETPKWHVPDEPAHYNYILYLVEKGSFPVLRMGDYPHHYLEELKAAGFPPHMSIAPIRYEFHQPPLYYLLGAALYKATAFLGLLGQFLLLRLLSVLMGSILLVVCYAIVKQIFPDDEFLALITAAFVATVPMHIAMTAAINNDALAELILALITWLCIKEIKAGLAQWQVFLLGLLLALALLTKTTIYAPAIVSVLLALALRARTERRATFVRRLGTILGMSLLSVWWFLRNLRTYGDLDLFAWKRHDAIVVGQPTTAQWLGKYGLSKVTCDFLATSFRSFWAQFGWMGILIDSRLYTLLALISVGVALGLIWFVARLGLHRQPLSTWQWWALILLLLVFVLVSAEHILYNLRFVQHQGRYLFPALVPIALAFALGLGEWVRIVSGLLSRAAPLRRLEDPLRRICKGMAFSLCYTGFVGLDLVCLYFFLVPYFQQ